MINKTLLNKLKKYYKKDVNNLIRTRLLNGNSFMNLVTDNKDSFNAVFNIEVDSHYVTNQKSTGRCWAFAGLNILREDVIKKCNLDYFELSESYIAFYDKLERFYLYLKLLKKYKKAGKNEDDERVKEILKSGFDDESNFFEFKSLISKYGVVPKNVYRDGYNSNDTSELNDLLLVLIRKYYLDTNNSELYLKNAYQLLCNVYGIPPDSFDFEYADKNGNYKIDKSLSPIDFYNKYISTNFNDNYIEVFSYIDGNYKNNNLYLIYNDSLISGINNNVVLNLKYERLEKLIIEQLKNNELVYFSSSTTSKYANGLWIDLQKRYSELLNIDFDMNRNEIIKTNGTCNEHSMVITGVNIKNNRIINWKIENSWGSKEGNNGYFVAEPEFVRKYLISAVINKKYLSKKELSVLNKEPIKLDKLDSKFC